MCLKLFSTNYESVQLQTQMHPEPAEQQVWKREGKLPLLHCTYNPQQFLYFFSISALPRSHNDTKRKKETVTSQIKPAINNTTSISQLLHELRHSEASTASTEGD